MERTGHSLEQHFSESGVFREDAIMCNCFKQNPVGFFTEQHFVDSESLFMAIESNLENLRGTGSLLTYATAWECFRGFSERLKCIRSLDDECSRTGLEMQLDNQSEINVNLFI